MDNFVDSGIDVPQREFVYRTWQITSRIEGQEKWKITRHEIIRKTSTLIYAYCAPYIDEKYGWEKAESSFELSRKELQEQGRCWVFFMSANFYPSEEAARAAIPKRVHLEPAQAAYFGLTKAITLQELNLAYCLLAHTLEPAMGGSAGAFAELQEHYQAALRTLGQ